MENETLLMAGYWICLGLIAGYGKREFYSRNSTHDQSEPSVHKILLPLSLLIVYGYGFYEAIDQSIPIVGLLLAFVGYLFGERLHAALGYSKLIVVAFVAFPPLATHVWLPML